MKCNMVSESRKLALIFLVFDIKLNRRCCIRDRSSYAFFRKDVNQCWRPKCTTVYWAPLFSLYFCTCLCDRPSAEIYVSESQYYDITLILSS